jgi:pyruvate/2-oxoglutarate dehydrogenase complex dihydrolipoamide acyltransferase (E2) component
MATRKPEPPKHPDVLPGEAELARLYQAGGNELPPPALDQHITTEAYRTVTLRQPPRRWAVPLSTAAVLVLAVSVGLLMTKHGALDRDGALSPMSEYSPPPLEQAPAAPADARQEERVSTPAKVKRPAPEPAPTIAESAASKPAPAEVMKKAESPPATAAPSALDRALEANQDRAAREDKARARSTTAGVAAMRTPAADVTHVQASGAPGAYQFNVTVKSPDTGCKQYADWWEVVSEDGKLLYRRVLLHSHVDEQPFTRSGGPVPIKADTVVWVRAHMNTSGYGGAALKGSVKGGFAKAEPPANFAASLAKQPPLPEGCDF